MDVLLASARPGQTAPALQEVGALVMLAGRAWTRQLLSPNLSAGRDAAGILTVVIPLLLLFPAAAAFAQLGLGVTWRTMTQFPGWGLWIIVACLVLWGPKTWARWVATLAVLAYSGGLVLQLSDLNFNKAVLLTGWLGPQIAGAVLLCSPDRIDRGRRVLGVIRPPLLGGLAALGGLVYVGLRIPQYYNVRYVLGLAGLMALVALGIFLIRSAVGRALLPAIAALASTVVVAQTNHSRYGNYSDVIPHFATIPGWSLLGTFVPWAVTAFVVLRMGISVIESRVARRP